MWKVLKRVNNRKCKCNLVDKITVNNTDITNMQEISDDPRPRLGYELLHCRDNEHDEQVKLLNVYSDYLTLPIRIWKRKLVQQAPRMLKKV